MLYRQWANYETCHNSLTTLLEVIILNFVLLIECSSQLVTMSPTTHIVDDARFVSSCFSCPSSARPLLSLLLANSGRTVYTFESVNPGPTGQPALEPMSTLLHHLLYHTSNRSSELYHHFRNKKILIKLHKSKNDCAACECCKQFTPRYSVFLKKLI